jgi:hypothetical protein
MAVFSVQQKYSLHTFRLIVRNLCSSMTIDKKWCPARQIPTPSGLYLIFNALRASQRDTYLSETPSYSILNSWIALKTYSKPCAVVS